MLSGNDVEVDDGDYHQRTALHLAASNGHIAMVRHLVLIHGANMNVLDRSGTCCLGRITSCDGFCLCSDCCLLRCTCWAGQASASQCVLGSEKFLHARFLAC